VESFAQPSEWRRGIAARQTHTHFLTIESRALAERITFVSFCLTY